MISISDRYFASVYLAMIGDKIGFGNGDRERNYRSEMITTDSMSDYNALVEGLSIIMIFRFIAEGGVHGIDLNRLIVSDDSEMHIATINGFTSDYANKEELYGKIVEHYLSAFKDIPYMRDTLLAGRQTIEAINSINSGSNWKKFPYNKNAGGSGAPMRAMCIGLVFHKSTDLLKLIESAIMITSITHPNCTGFIGSIIAALFVSYAIRGLNLETWIFEIINLLESDIIDGVIEDIKPTYIEYFKSDKKNYLYKILTYVETSFDNFNYVIGEKHIRSVYPHKRMLYYYDNFATNKKVINPGSGADDCIIIAYDCLLMSKSNYEKLIYTSMIHIGDSDTVGTIASAWYGALYGFADVPSNIISSTNKYYEDIYNLTLILYNKFYEININKF
jgi:ADP-ribosylarginine hydrolase